MPVVRGHRVKSCTYRDEGRPDLAQALLVVSPHQEQPQQNQQQQQQQQQQLLLRPRTTSSEYRVRRSASVQAAQSCSIKVIGRQVSSPSLGRPQTSTLGLERHDRGHRSGSRQATPRPQAGLLKVDKSLSDILAARDLSVTESLLESSGKRRQKSCKLNRSSSLPSAPLSVKSAAVALSNRPSSSAAQPTTRSRPNTAAAPQVRTQNFDLELSHIENSKTRQLEYFPEKSSRKHSRHVVKDSTEIQVDTCGTVTNTDSDKTACGILTDLDGNLCGPGQTDITPDGVIPHSLTSLLMVEREVSNSNSKETILPHTGSRYRSASPSASETYLEPEATGPVSKEKYSPSGKTELSPPALSQSEHQGSLRAAPSVGECQPSCEDALGTSQQLLESAEAKETLHSFDGTRKSPDDHLSVAASSVIDSESTASSSIIDSDLNSSSIVKSHPGDEVKEYPSHQPDRQGMELVDRASTYKIKYRGSHSAEVTSGPRAPRCSIAEEIRRQNQLLEERNSDVSRVGQITDNLRLEPAAREAELGRQVSGLVINKGEVCGSPGFSLLQGQLKTAVRKGDKTDASSPHHKMGIMPRSTLTDKGRRPLRGLCCPDDRELPAVTGGSKARLRGRESVDALCVEGDACGTESASSTTSSSAPSPALAPLSRVSVQDSSLLSAAVNRAISDSKVRVSLAFLKEKQGGLCTGFRHRLSAAPDNGSSSVTLNNNNNNSNNPTAASKAGDAPHFCVKNVKSPRQGQVASPSNTPRYVYVGFEVEESGSERGEAQKEIFSEPR